MGFLVRKQKGLYRMTGIAKLTVVAFIVSMGYALVDTVWAIYLYDMFGNLSVVSFVAAFLTLIAFVSYFALIPVVEKTNKSRLYLFSLLIIAASYLVFLVVRSTFVFLLAATTLVVFTCLRMNAFGIILRDRSSKKTLNRNEGLTYTFVNLAWLIGPLISGFISQEYGINIIFLLSSFFILLGFFIFKISKINDPNIKKKTDDDMMKNFFAFFKDKNRVLAYIVGGGVNFWLILLYLYIPVYIIQNGLNDLWVGYFLFAIVVIPVLIEYRSSKIVKRFGYRNVFKTGFFILGLAALICFFLSNIYWVLGVLVLGSLGIALIEPTTESYFFEILKRRKDESRFYGPYNTTIDFNLFIAKVFSGVLLIFLDFKFIFLLFSAAMFFFFLVSNKVKNIKTTNKAE